jgi:hypothetical protein
MYADGPMRVAPLVTLVALAAMLVAPFAAFRDADSNMACCMAGGEAACCPVPGSADCALQRCSPEGALAHAALLPPFLLPPPPASAAPAASLLVAVAGTRSSSASEPELPDPPPRA